MNKVVSLTLTALLLAPLASAVAAETQLSKMLRSIDQTIAQGSYKPDWESLKAHTDPEWFRDAKFGIWTCWGPDTVGVEEGPAGGGPGGGAQWYGRNMYDAASPTFNYHRKQYGDQNTVGYKDLIPKFTGEQFDPEAWADLFARSGAKFAGPLAIFHDNFAMWDSQLTRWNSVGMGPHRDVTGEMAKAIRAHGLKFITTFHHGFAWRFFEPSFKYDGADPQYADLYTEAHAPKTPASKHFQDQWMALVYEVLGKYQPDLIYFDFEFGTVIQPEYRQRLFAMAYDWAAQNNRTIGVTQKNRTIHEYTGILDHERGREDRLVPYPWMTDTCAGQWFHQKSAKFKSVDQLVPVLVDIVSKNGCLLLDVGPHADGTIPDKGRRILLGMGDWLKINGEAIYGSRPWSVYGEGPARQAKAGGLSEDADRPFTARDIRFTTQGGTLYAIGLVWPEDGKLVVKSLATTAGKISDVALLGHPGKLDWQQTGEGLVVTLPGKKPGDIACTLKITAGDLKPVPVIYDSSIQADAAGTLVLPAAGAEIHGKTPQYKRGGRTEQIGFWSDPKDFVSWSFKVDQPGVYQVEVTYSCAAPGSEFTVEVGNQTLSGKCTSTGSWESYRTDNLGALTLDRPGSHALNLKPKSDPKWKAIGLSSLSLKVRSVRAADGANSAAPITVNRVRFFPAPGHEQAMLAGRICGSNISARDGFEPLAEIKSVPLAGKWAELSFPNAKRYRWIRYEAPPGSHGNVAELEFYCGKKKMDGHTFGSLGWRSLRNWFRAFDGKTDTWFDSDIADGQYLGVDVGELATAQSPRMDPPPGPQKGPLRVRLTCNTPGAIIRYSFTGMPEPNHDPLYQEPIVLDRPTTIFAVAYKEGLPPSPTAYGTYIVGSALKPGLQTLHVGNSLTASTCRLAEYAKSAGFLHDYHLSNRIAGTTPAIWVSIQSKTKAAWDKELSTLPHIDHFSVQPRLPGFTEADLANEAKYDVLFFDAARAKSPQVQPWIYAEWPSRRPGFNGWPPPSATFEEACAALMMSTETIERKVCEGYRGEKRPRILPCTLAVAHLKNLLDQGKVPGLSSRDMDLLMFYDNVHPGGPGCYMLDLIWFAAFYGQCPVGEIPPLATDLTAQQAAVIQQLAWDVVKNYPDCGLYEEGALPAAKPTFTPAPDKIGEITSVTLSSSTPGAWFRYTLDGNEPTRTRGYVYCGVVSVHSGMTLKALAYKSGMADSPVSVASYPRRK